MKKLLVLLSSLFVALTLTAQSHIYVHKKDGTVVSFTVEELDSISFNNKETSVVAPPKDYYCPSTATEIAKK